MKNAALTLAFRVLVAVTGSSSVGTGDCETAVALPKLECRIAPNGSQCYTEVIDQRMLDLCDRYPCLALSGMQLNVSCDVDDSQILFRGNVNSTLSGKFISWPFPASSAAEGLYECRSDNSSLVANRFVIVDDAVHVTSANAPYEYSCERNIIPGYNCCVALTPNRYSLRVPDADKRRTVLFNVFGARPIDLSVEVIWVNHYPVDLDLSWNRTASTSTSLHSVTLSTRGLLMVGGRQISFYVAISANSSYGSSTMCVFHEIIGDPVLFSDENTPSDLTVVEHQSANFSCQAQTLDNNYYAFTSNTVAFLVRPPDSSELTQCLNCSFSMSELTRCREMVDEGSCSGLQFINSSFGHPDVLTHNLTAHWSEVDMRHSGYEVVCAIAVSGITQWAHTATLTVTPATPTPTPSANHGQILRERDIVLLTSGVVVLGSITGASVVGLILLCRHKRRHTYWSPASTHKDKKTFVKFEKICD